MCGRVGDKAQHRGGQVKEIKVNRQWVREREKARNGRTDRQRETETGRRRDT